MQLNHSNAEINGLQMHYVTAGEGPAIILCHGFPEIWYSWRKQIGALAEAGFKVIAPDLRGFGDSTGPAEAEHYTSIDVMGDLLKLMDFLGVEKAGICGHDWGATIAWNSALLRPDRFTAVASLSVPLTPRGPNSLPGMLKLTAPPSIYMLYFLEPGLAEKELDADGRTFLRRIFYTNSGNLAEGLQPNMFVAETGRLTDSLYEPAEPLAWLTEEDLDVYEEAYRKSGFRGALNTYRSLHRSWELMAGWEDLKIEVPALYVGGTRDIVLSFPGMMEAVEMMKTFAPKAEAPIMLEGIGHWIQHEAPESTNKALIEFFGKVL